MGEADALFCSLFRTDVECAMLACDDAGLLPEELLYLPRDVFLVGIATAEQGMIRYNMRERFRQEMFRKVFGMKRALLLKGRDHIAQRWALRSDMYPEAAAAPDLDRIPRKKVAEWKHRRDADEEAEDDPTAVVHARRTEDEALDTESDDDGLDEYFRPKPPPMRSEDEKTRGDALGNTPPTSTNPLDHSLYLWNNGTLHSSLTARSSRRKQIAEPPPAPRLAIPHVPNEPPRCRALSARHLQSEERHLELSRKRLARYGTKVEKAVEMTLARKQEICDAAMTCRSDTSASVSPTRVGGTLVPWGPSHEAQHHSTHLDHPFASSITLPKIPPSHLEAKRQLAAMVRRTMVNIAESAIGFNTFRDVLDDQREEGQVQDSLRRSRNQETTRGSKDEWLAQEAARKKRDQELIAEQQRIKDAYEAYTTAKTEKTQVVLQSKRQHHILTNEVQRMRQMFANQKREWMHRREDARVTSIVARSEPKHQHAQSLLAQRKADAEQRRLQHVQMELLRKELKNSVTEMNVRNEWEVPRLLEQLASRSPTRQSVVSSDSPPPL
jgi:hypothetical protein